MQIFRSLILFTQLLVLATTQKPTPKDGLTLFLESAMKEFPKWLKFKLGDSLLHPDPVQISENNEFIELKGQIRDLVLNGYTEQYATVQADFLRKSSYVNIKFLPNLELVGNYRLQGQVLNNSISGEGVIKLRNFRYSDYSYASIRLYRFGIIPDGRIDLDTADVFPYSRIFTESLPEFEGLESAGYSKHIGKLVKSYFVRPLERLLSDHLETFVRTRLKYVSLSKIIQDNYDGNLNNSFIDNDMHLINNGSYTTEISDDETTTATAAA